MIPRIGQVSVCTACKRTELGQHDTCCRCGKPSISYDDGRTVTFLVGQVVWVEENVSKTQRRLSRWVPIKITWTSGAVIEGVTQDARRAPVKLVCRASSALIEAPPPQPKEARVKKSKTRKRSRGQRYLWLDSEPTMRSGDPT